MMKMIRNQFNKKLRHFKSMIVVSSLLITNATYASQPLPENLLMYIASLDTQYSFIKPEQLIKTPYYGWPKAEVQIVDDFDGDGEVDFSLLLNHDKTALSVVIFLTRGCSFEHFILEVQDRKTMFNPDTITMVMASVSKGPIDIYQQGSGLHEGVDLKNNSIEILYADHNNSNVFYWYENKFISSGTGD